MRSTTIRQLVVATVLGLALLTSVTPALARDASIPGSPAPASAVASGTPAADRDADASASASDSAQVIRGLEQALRAIFAATAFSAIGTLVFVRTVWDGSGREFAFLCRLIRWAALVAAMVVVAQLVVRAALVAGGWSGALPALPALFATSYGSGMALRAAGAVLLSTGASILRRRPRSTMPATVGAVLIVGSFALAGYAADSEPWAISMFAIVAHVAAAAAWVGGLLALVLTLWHRGRTGRPLRAGYIAARFSVVATYGVALVAIAGVALAFVRLGSVSALWATPYGVTLVVKVALVAVVGGIGAYNHYVVVPVLPVTPDHAIGRRLRWLGYVELAMFVAVIGVNSSLVGLAG